MSTHPRITPADVRAAMEKTGLELVQSKWWEIGDHGQPCGACALSVLCAAEEPELFARLVDDDDTGDELCRRAEDIYGEGYVHSFLEAFDGDVEEAYEDCTQREALGYADGARCRKELLT